jgi:hypothetical protein
MIGSHGTKIVIGYRFQNLPDPGVATLQAARVTHAEVAQFHARAVTKLRALREVERIAKAGLEEAKNTAMASGIPEQEKHDYLFDDYVPKLRAIGISLAKARQAIGPDIQSLRGRIPGQCTLVEQEEPGQWQLAVQTPAGTRPVLTLLFGAAGFAPVANQTTPRPVYRKILDPLLAAAEEFNTYEYVLDDRDVFTRRYAYAAKSIADLARLYKREALTGRFQGAHGGDIRKVTPDLRKRFPALKGVGQMTLEQAMHVHQELGSGDHQRGICLSSANKLLHGNRGGAFYTESSDIIKLDLARVPTGQDLLFNLYSQPAQELTVGLAGGKPGTTIRFSQAPVPPTRVAGRVRQNAALRPAREPLPGGAPGDLPAVAVGDRGRCARRIGRRGSHPHRADPRTLLRELR